MRKTALGAIRLRVFAVAIGIMTFSEIATAHPLKLDDVFETVSVDSAQANPNGEEIAISITRPVAEGEVFGRNAYEIDTSRSDVWIVDRQGRQAVNVTNGKERGAGYWCPHWSPSGSRLAMLSTQPEDKEPHGGDNVRLYVWKSGSDAPRRISGRAVLAQTRYGSPINAVDFRSSAQPGVQSCREGDENAPFIWLDDRRILALLTTPGTNSPMVERYSLAGDEAAETNNKIREGAVPTYSVSDTRMDERLRSAAGYRAELSIINVDDGAVTRIAEVPAFPFRGALSVMVSPDRKVVAVLAPFSAIAPSVLGNSASVFGDWRVHKRLGIFSLVVKEDGSWLELPFDARFPVDLIDWSPDSTAFVMRSRADPSHKKAGFWVVDERLNSVQAIDVNLESNSETPAHMSVARLAIWIDDESLLIKAAPVAAADMGNRWYMTSRSGTMPLSGDPGRELQQHPNGAVFETKGGVPVRLDWEVRERLPSTGDIGSLPCSDAIGHLQRNSESGQQVTRFDSDGSNAKWVDIPSNSRILSSDCRGIVWEEKDQLGTRVRHVSWEGGNRPITLLELNNHLEHVSWGQRKLIEYVDANGESRLAAAIFPPEYDDSVKYPTLFWVYGGYIVRGLNGFFLDRYQSGIYNLELYAAQGYVVVVPSMPIEQGGDSDPLSQLGVGVLPAADKLVELGIADPDSIGLLGQSFGGFSVTGLISKTDRFAAAVALAGVTDQASNYSSFDPTARGYPGIEQDMSENAIITTRVIGLGKAPWEDPNRYDRNSPLTFVQDINTPLMLVHGDLDIRADLTQAEMLFMQLYHQDKPARLLRYWGENHSLANSPANVRSIFEETIAWFDFYLKDQISE